MAPAPGRRRERRRDRTAQAAVLGLAVLAAFVAGIAGNPRPGRAEARSSSPDVAAPASTPAAPPHSMLFGHVGRDRRLDLLVAFGWERGARRGTALLVPPALVAEVPALGAQALADVPTLAAAKDVEVVVENELGVDFDRALFVDDAKLAASLAPAGPLAVDFPRRARIEDAEGVAAFHAGRRTVAPEYARRFLVARTGDQLAQLDVVGAVLEGWLAAIADPTAAAATRQADRRLAPLTRAREAQLRVRTLPVEQTSTAGGERFRLRVAAARDVVERAFQWAVVGPGTRPRVEVLNGAGGPRAILAAAARIVPAGGHVVLTGNVPGFAVPATRVVYYRPVSAVAARRVAKALGAAKVVAATDANDVVDLTVIVGEDFQQST
jgi:hypothetical protein